jgi:hypothetical protein
MRLAAAVAHNKAVAYRSRTLLLGAGENPICVSQGSLLCAGPVAELWFWFRAG